jgi:hypothetical protein
MDSLAQTVRAVAEHGDGEPVTWKVHPDASVIFGEGPGLLQGMAIGFFPEQGQPE